MNNTFLYFFKIIYLACKTLIRKMSRTIFMTLGIIVSIVAIMLTMTLGKNVEKYVNDEVAVFGTNTIQVEISVPETDHVSTENITSIAQGVEITTLTDKDARAIEKLASVEATNVGIIGQKPLTYDGDFRHATLLGSGKDMLLVDPAAKITSGRYFSPEEVDTSAHTIVLGSDIAKDIFSFENPLGKNVRIGGSTYRVIGTLEPRGSTFGISYDDFVYIPYTTLQKEILGTDFVQFITVTVTDEAYLNTTAKDIESLLRSRHDITDPKDDDFAVTTIQEAQDLLGEIFGMMTILLVILASISIIVGGVGIMNMMLMSVEERKKEIGLRKALGAKPRDILLQFLIESVVITFFAALLGILISLLILFALSSFLHARDFAFDLIIPASAIFTAIFFSFAAGILFGTYPAKAASKISPIDAMR